MFNHFVRTILNLSTFSKEKNVLFHFNEWNISYIFRPKKLAETHSSLIFNTRESVLFFFFNSRDLAAISFPFLRSSTVLPPCSSRKNSLDHASMPDPGRGGNAERNMYRWRPRSKSSGASRGHASRSFERREKKGSKGRG